ncbi:hypothetical protein FACS1894211_05200 [Clostridia bacterium]|nr:hypothetical protein FACS1894211_05200 [Clostridia bacterium]
MIVGLAEKIKALRTENGLTQKELERGIGYSQSAIAHWESGDKDLSASAITALVAYFNVSADYLLGLKNDDGSFTPPPETDPNMTRLGHRLLAELRTLTHREQEQILIFIRALKAK